MVGHARRVLVAEELHIAAERDRGDLPARAVAVVEADEFRTEADRERQHLECRTSARSGSGQAHGRTRRSSARTGTERYSRRARRRMRSSPPNDVKLHHNPQSPPVRRASVTESYLGCLYGNFGQEVAGQTSRNMVNGDGGLDRCPARANSPRAAAASSVASTSAGNAGEADAPGDEFADRDLVGGIEHGRRRPARLHGRARQPQAPGNGSRSGASKVSSRDLWQDRAAAPDRRCARGQARQCAIGMRMSGEPSCATTEPSRNSTRPCTTDCGCTSTSISSGGSANR